MGHPPRRHSVNWLNRKRSPSKFQLPKLLDLRGYVMEGIYRETSAPHQQNDEALTKGLKKLVAQLGVVMGTISTAGANVVSEGALVRLCPRPFQYVLFLHRRV
jgi:hypothetical protein